jgi:hypothetical protein
MHGIFNFYDAMMECSYKLFIYYFYGPKANVEK